MKTMMSCMALWLFLFSACQQVDENVRVTRDFNFNWKFARHNISDAQLPGFDDSQWRTIRLPHDWSVEEGFSQENTAGATAFLPGGIGWYRKSFKLSLSDKNKITRIEFDGIYTNSTVWINGTKLGFRPYGYIPFSYDLSPYLHFGDSTNVIVVKADRSAYVDCRWYPGSGIYRKVKLVTSNKIYIPQWGTFVTTPQVSKDKAQVNIVTQIKNEFDVAKDITLRTSIIDNNSDHVNIDAQMIKIEAFESTELLQNVSVETPKLWDTENPNLYTALSEIIIDGKVIDEYRTTFGIRKITYDAAKGFFLNGIQTEIKGVNLHHDGGLVGAAVPDGVWERRLTTLKQGGCNAIRTAHNPPSEAFLDLCDRMGFLVQDEAFDEFDNPKSKRHNFNQEKAEDVTTGYTEYFQQWQEKDIKAMVLRDRNHPSIIMWSIGNEIEWTYPRYGSSTGYWGGNKATPTTNYYLDAPPLSIEEMKNNFYSADSGMHNLAHTAQNLSAWVKELDTTRPVTANLVMPSIGHFSGYADALDIIGYSYRQVVYDYGHEHYPKKLILGTENFPRYHEWKDAHERDFIPGIFIWKGVGYLGESRSWPNHGGGTGLLNLAGFKNPAYHHFKSFWNDKEPSLYLTTQTIDKSPYTVSTTGNVIEKEKGWWRKQKWGWQNVNEYWNYTSGDSVMVEAYTSCEHVELFLNEKSMGIQKLNDNDDRVLKWCVPFTSGKLIAKGTMNDGSVIEEIIHTAGDPAMMSIISDKQNLKANSYDVAHIVVQLGDEQDYDVKHVQRRVTFNVEGDCRILGVDNGDGSNVEGFNSNTVMTYKGKCLMIIQANSSKGNISVTAQSEGMEDATIHLRLN
ncbi:DUF4982 domain-containing protein [Bacteroidales bacterium]|nr:DUF4982 domain-containing protein [Bacteroidales bacterium]